MCPVRFAGPSNAPRYLGLDPTARWRKRLKNAAFLPGDRFPGMGLADAVGDEGWMRKLSKNIAKARAAVTQPAYHLQDAVSLLQKVKYAKFDETVDLTMRLGVDTRHADQMVRGTVVLPHGLGKTKTVAVIATGDRQKEAHEAGADFV